MSQNTETLLKTRISFALGILAIALASSIAILYISSSQQEGYASLVNISGRQRMLSQRLVLHAFQKREKKLGEGEEKIFYENLNLFQVSHQELLQLSPTASGELSPPLKDHFYGKNGLDKEVKNFLDQVQIFFQGDQTDEEFQKFIAFVKGPFLEKLDRTVTLFESESDKITHRLQLTETAILVIGLLTLIGIYLFIFRPLSTTILNQEDELIKARTLAEEQAEFKAMFLATMSHELRTPLNGILGMADLMNSSQIDGEQKERVVIIEECANTLLNIVNNILDLTKLEMGHMNLESIPFSPQRILTQVRYTFDYMSAAKGINLKVTIDESVPEFVKGDPTRITQVINNLVGNALKFTEDGHISVNCHHDGKFLNILVEDTGIGMTPQQTEKVFSPFIQADLSTTRRFGGTGLGLSITKEIITAMDGMITVSSEVGVGTKFNVSIPLTATEPPQDTSLKHEILGERIFGKILVVDDNEINCKMLSKLITRLGYEVDYAMNPKAVTELLEDNDYSLMFMDYHMPQIDGPTLFTRLKEKKIKLPPTIAFTADLLESTRDRVLEVGMRELLAKPIRKNILKDVIERYI